MGCIVIADVGASFLPSGMYKNGTMSTTSAWTQITGWTADTSNYPGSSISSNALVVQGSKSGATVTASIAWVVNFQNDIEVRLKQNGTVIATGTANTSSPSTVTATGVTVADGDLITVEEEDTSGYSGAGYAATISSGASTYVRVT